MPPAVTQISSSEHGAQDWAISHGNHLLYFEAPGKVRRVLKLSKPFSMMTSRAGGLYFGTQEGAEMGKDQTFVNRMGQARAEVLYLPFNQMSETLQRSPPPYSDRLWDSESISAGDRTDPVSCWGYDSKTIKFLSDTAGTLTIYGDVYGNSLEEYDSVSISADTPEFYEPTADLCRMQLAFDTAATVTAEVDFK